MTEASLRYIERETGCYWGLAEPTEVLYYTFCSIKKDKTLAKSGLTPHTKRVAACYARRVPYELYVRGITSAVSTVRPVVKRRPPPPRVQRCGRLASLGSTRAGRALRSAGAPAAVRSVQRGAGVGVEWGRAVDELWLLELAE